MLRFNSEQMKRAAEITMNSENRFVKVEEPPDGSPNGLIRLQRNSTDQ